MVVIAPAASKAERNWLPERYAAFADFVQQQGRQIVLCGGPTEMERELGQQIEKHCQSRVSNFIGRTSLKQLLAVIKGADVVLAPDTGPTHMAVTVGTPVIGLYAHSNPRRTGPYTCQEYVVSCYDEVLKEQTGQNAEQHRWGKRVKGESLMARLTLEAVIESYSKLMMNR